MQTRKESCQTKWGEEPPEQPRRGSDYMTWEEGATTRRGATRPDKERSYQTRWREGATRADEERELPDQIRRSGSTWDERRELPDQSRRSYQIRVGDITTRFPCCETKSTVHAHTCTNYVGISRRHVRYTDNTYMSCHTDVLTADYYSLHTQQKLHHCVTAVNNHPTFPEWVGACADNMYQALPPQPSERERRWAWERG